MSTTKILVSDELPGVINNCIKGDRQAQNKLYNMFAGKMFAVCLRYSKSREEAEEILQEGFMQVFDHLTQFNYAGSFEGWIRKIMVNCALQKYRSKSHLHSIVDIEAVDLGDVSNDNIIAQLGTKELLNLVQQLPPTYKIIFNLYVFEGMKHREIAELLKISEGTSKSNLSDARKILQKAVHDNLQSRNLNVSYL